MGVRYAEGTKVEVGSSRGEISAILAKHGVMRMGWSTGPDGDELLFELNGRRYRFTIAKPTLPDVRKMYPNAYDHNAKLDGEWRRRWRANVLLIKAKLEFADGETTTVDREFLPYLLVERNRTLGELVDDGDLPKLIGVGA